MRTRTKNLRLVAVPKPFGEDEILPRNESATWAVLSKRDGSVTLKLEITSGGFSKWAFPQSQFIYIYRECI
jgi:hypothetical protein